MIVAFDNVHLSYGPHKKVLEGVSFALPSGSFHFLTGPSGAGKTTLLNLIFMACRPSEGRIMLFGRDTAELARKEMPAIRRRLGFVYQDFRLIPHLTALENVALPLRLAGATEEQVRDHVEQLLHWLGLEGLANAMPQDLSGGEQQRVAIARAVINKPDLLLADEPTGNVDSETAALLLRLMIQLNNIGTAVLLATHQQTLIDQIGFPALRLENGRLIAPAEEAA